MRTSDWTVPATQFRDKCPKLLDMVMTTGNTLVVTKHGRPVAAVVPFAEQAEDNIIGWANEMVLDHDLTQPAIPPERWNAISDPTKP